MRVGTGDFLEVKFRDATFGFSVWPSRSWGFQKTAFFLILMVKERRKSVRKHASYGRLNIVASLSCELHRHLLAQNPHD